MVKLAIIYGTGFGSTGLMAKAIEEGATSAGAQVVIKKFEDASATDIENADVFAIGSPTYKALAMPAAIKFVESLSTISLKGKTCTSFGSYGWSGEAPEIIGKMLKGYGVDLIEPPLRIKRQPVGDGIQECKKFGQLLAKKIK